MIERLRRFWAQIHRRPYWYVPYYTNTKIAYFGFEDLAGCVGPGWRDILAKLSDKLFMLGWDGGLLQVKEKFGGLRFYWKNNIKNPIIASIAEDAVEVAEYRSTQTCDRCGKYGRARGDGWIYTLCDEHWEKALDDRRLREEASKK